MREASNTGESILKIATIMSIILPFGIWASKCIPSSRCAMLLFLTGACGGRAFSNSARLQWPTNLASSLKKNTWEAKTQMGNWLALCSETWPIQNIYFTDEETDPHRAQSSHRCRRGIQLRSPGSCGSSCFLPCSTASATAPVQIYISCLWVLFFLGRSSSHRLQCLLGPVKSRKWAEWRMTDTAGECGTPESTHPAWQKVLVLTEGVWAWYGDGFQFFKKSQKSQFLFEISRAGQAKENLHSRGHLPAACRLQPPSQCMLLTSLTAVIIGPVV